MSRTFTTAIASAAAAILTTVHPRVEAQDLTEISALLRDPVFWQLGPDAMLSQHGGLGLHFDSERKRQASARGRNAMLCGVPVSELRVSFKGGTVRSLRCVLFSRREQELAADAFAQQLQDTVRGFTEALGEEPDRDRSRSRRTDAQREQYVWHAGGLEYELTAVVTRRSRTDIRPEYIRVDVKQTTERSSGPGDAMASLSELRKRVSRKRNGDLVVRGISAVDQGTDGYCACAVAEQVLRFLGRDIDQHEVAQLTGTTRRNGTSIAALEKAMRAISRKARVRFEEEGRSLGSFRALRDLVSDYNREARRREGEKVELGRPSETNAADVFHYFDPKILRSVRAKKADRRRFERTLERHLTNGLPVVWTVVLGLVREEGDRHPGSGGHMRLIVGLNTKSDEVIYADPWGQGHTKKRMDTRDAMTITTGIYVIRPR